MPNDQKISVDERAAFERELVKRIPNANLQLRDADDEVRPGEYEHATHEFAWRMWQARAALATRIAKLYASGGTTGFSDYLMTDGSVKTLKVAEIQPDDWQQAATAPTTSEAVRALLAKVPVKPHAITFDKGWELLDELQRIAEMARANAEGEKS
jgi:hypothetical protein